MAHLIKGLIISSHAAAIGNLLLGFFRGMRGSSGNNGVGVNRGRPGRCSAAVASGNKNAHNFILQLPVKPESIRAARPDFALL